MPISSTLNTNGIPPFVSLLSGAAASEVQAPSEEGTDKAGLWDGVLLSCSASPSLATHQQKSLPPQKAGGWGSSKPKCHFGFTPGSLQGLVELPQYLPRTVRASAIKHPRVTREKKLKASLSPLPLHHSALYLTSPCPQTGGKPDSLPIMVISHPYTWLWSVEKETGLIFQQFMARYSCWQKEL